MLLPKNGQNCFANKPLRSRRAIMVTRNHVFMQKSLAGWFLVFILFPSLPSFSEGVNFVDEYAVFDANDKRVGRAVGTTTFGQIPGGNSIISRVAVEVDDHFFALTVGNLGFGGAQAVFFESDDCTGTPLMDLPPPSLIFPTAAAVFGENGQVGNIVYTPNLDETPSSINVHSVGLVPGCNPAN
ncbi:MAG: hypothetical protein R3351_00820, partial [Nitrospirales bacterium]|nr:hypothetical protein [Nitrospirales bacterium]